MGLIRSHYVGRTFIEPQDSIRHFGVRLKLSPVRSIVDGKRVVVVDDSLVRGTTSRKIVKMLRARRRQGGAPADQRAADDAPLLLRHRHADAQRARRRVALGRRDQHVRHERLARVPVARGHDGGRRRRPSRARATARRASPATTRSRSARRRPRPAASRALGVIDTFAPWRSKVPMCARFAHS